LFDAPRIWLVKIDQQTMARLIRSPFDGDMTFELLRPDTMFRLLEESGKRSQSDRCANEQEEQEDKLPTDLAKGPVAIGSGSQPIRGSGASMTIMRVLPISI
jgi:hypothetical protein